MRLLAAAWLLCFVVLAQAEVVALPVRGVVVDNHGEALAAATVSVVDMRMMRQCDEQGHFAFDLPAGHYRLQVQLVGYGSAEQEVQAGDTAVVVRLRSLGMLNAITVTATRTPRTLANTPIVTKVISSEEIAASDASTVREVLEQELPGVEFSYSMNQQVAINVQGTGGMSVLFLVDGERLAGETLDNIDYGRLNVSDVERIEVIKGAATVLYGSNAVGAVVNIITKRQNDPWSLSLNGRHASRYGQYGYGATAGVKQGRWSNLLNMNTDGASSYYVVDTDGDSTQVYGNQQWNFKDKMSLRLSDRISLTGRVGYYFHERDDAVDDKPRARDFSGGLRLASAIGDSTSLEASYSFDRYDKSDFYPLVDKEYLDYKNVQNSCRLLMHHSFSPKLELSLGVDAMDDYLLSYQFSADASDHRQQTADLFAQAEWEPSAHWNIIGGIRVDYFSLYGVECSPKVAAMYKSGHYRLRATYAKGFRAPTLKELYMDFNMANIFNIYGNADLESEVSHCFTLSAEYGDEYATASATAYYNRLGNEITTVWNPAMSDGRGAMEYRNVEGTDLASVDLALRLRTDGGFAFKAGYTLFHEFPRGDALPTSDTRPHSVTAQASYEQQWSQVRMTATLGARYLSAATYYVITTSTDGAYDSYEPFTSSGYGLVKLVASAKFWDCLTVTATVDNLLNYRPQHYAYNSPYTLGRTYIVGLSLDLPKH